METNASAREQFNRNAEKYRDEPLFAAGEDLRRMTESLRLTGRESLLDLGAGAGHVALAFASSVRECVGVDISERMVAVAQEFARSKGASNVSFRLGSADELPFPDGAFDIVTCRFTAHHFDNLAAAVAEIARVLRPGGTLVVVDHYAPADEELDQFVNDLDRMRDPSHVRESTLGEWQELLAREGLAWSLISMWELPLEVENWLERAATPPEERRRVIQHLSSAPARCAEAFRIVLDEEGFPHSFSLKMVLFHGSKDTRD